MDFFHGIRVKPGSKVSQPSPGTSDTVIGLVGTSVSNPTSTATKIYTPGEPYLVESTAEIKSFKGGSIEDSLAGIFAQGKAKVVVVVAPSSTTIPEYIEKLKFAEQRTGVKPNILIAPIPIEDDPPSSIEVEATNSRSRS